MPPKKVTVPRQTCFSTVQDKLVQGTVPCAALCWLNAQCAFIIFAVECIGLFFYLLTLEFGEKLSPCCCIHSWGSILQKWAVCQNAAFSITKESFLSCAEAVDGREELVLCNSGLMAWNFTSMQESLSCLGRGNEPPWMQWETNQHYGWWSAFPIGAFAVR